MSVARASASVSACLTFKCLNLTRSYAAVQDAADAQNYSMLIDNISITPLK